MVKLASWLVNEQDLGEEIVQDVFVKLAAPDFAIEELASPRAYLRTAVVHQSRSRIRRLVRARRHRPERSLPVDGPEDFLADQELADAIKTLPRRQREVVVLRFTDDLKVADIAATLGLAEGTVKKHLHRALATLRQLLESPTQTTSTDALPEILKPVSLPTEDRLR